MVCRYYYVEKDCQARQASMHHIMRLQQQHPEWLLALTIHGYQCIEQHHITKGPRFGQDRISGPGQIKMATSRFITGYDRLRIFRPQIRVILGIDSSAAIFQNL